MAFLEWVNPEAALAVMSVELTRAEIGPRTLSVLSAEPLLDYLQEFVDTEGNYSNGDEIASLIDSTLTWATCPICVDWSYLHAYFEDGACDTDTALNIANDAIGALNRWLQYSNDERMEYYAINPDR